MNITLIALLQTLATLAAPLDERDLLITALSQDSDIKLMQTARIEDSLSLKVIESGWLPSISLSAGTSLQNSAEEKSLPHTDTPKSSKGVLESGVSVTQNIPGGGMLSGEIQGAVTNDLTSTSTSHGSSFTLSYMHSLLRDGWKNAPLEYTLRISKIDNSILSLEQRKMLASRLSQIRSLFWNLYEQKSLLEVYQNELAQAEMHLKTEQARFRIGEAAALDTLSAALGLMSAQQSILDAQIGIDGTTNELALALMMDPDSLQINDSADLSIPDLPDPSTMLSLVEQYDPSLRIFDHVAERIDVQKDKNKNALLPRFDIGASVTHNRLGNKTLSDDFSSNNAVISCVLTYAFPLRPARIENQQLKLAQHKNDIRETKYREELKKQLRNLQYSWKQEKQRLSIAEKSCELARLQLATAQKSYDLGTIDQLTLLDARNKLVSSESGRIKSSIRMKHLQVIFDELTGTIFHRFGLQEK